MALPALQRFSRGAPIDEMLAAYRRDGAFVVDELFDRTTIEEMRAAADGAAPGFEPGTATQGMGEAGTAFVGANTIRFSSLGTLTPAYFDLLDDETWAAIADAILLPHCGGYWVNTGQVMYILPGEPAQALHRDADNWWEYVRSAWPDVVDVTVSAMIGLGDVTEETGATRVIPGSHRWPELAYHLHDHETVAADLGPGDALIYSGYVLHGGGANTTTDRVRRAMHLSFVAGWLTPEESCALDYTAADLADRSPRVRQLLGHRSYSPVPHEGGGLWLRHVREIDDD